MGERRLSTLAPVLLLAWTPAPALAADGILEINQACAAGAGCFAGDTAGYPVTITAAGSFRLTSNLVVPTTSTDGIRVSASDVSIDLNDFTIIGTACVGATASCNPTSGTGFGIALGASGVFGTSVRDGSVVGMGSTGLHLGVQSRATNLRVRWNREDGILMAGGGLVSGNVVSENGRDGISVSTPCSISGNTLYQNGRFGINGATQLMLSGNIAYQNGTVGIRSAGFSMITQNTAHHNGQGGIEGGAGSVVSGNSAYFNGVDGINAFAGAVVTDNSVYDNGGDGIQTGQGSLIQRNASRLNTSFGLNLEILSGYRENTITSNTGGAVAGFGTNLGGNACNGALICP